MKSEKMIKIRKGTAKTKRKIDASGEETNNNEQQPSKKKLKRLGYDVVAFKVEIKDPNTTFEGNTCFSFQYMPFFANVSIIICLP